MRRRGSRRWLPRPRGDRPIWSVSTPLGLGAPPPTRGSSAPSRMTGGATPGSPAHAGIVPRLAGRSSCLARLPRPRGDRPDTSTPLEPVGAAPPPTRGSSHFGLTSHAPTGGSPAHAGIVRSCRHRRGCVGRLPRPRGDRPSQEALNTSKKVAPPPTRGSSPGLARGRRRRPGSPAHAGIVPSASRIMSGVCWLPRPRGDRPRHADTSTPRSRAPPPTRGSSPRRAGSCRVSAGSPAHAGIVPDTPTRRLRDLGLPRPRGDRPFEDETRETFDMAPPPTRGSSCRARPSRGLLAGSPAHAGIVPLQAAPGFIGERLPRPRGDRPVRQVFKRITDPAPPPTRGSSPRASTVEKVRRGSPAHAGIVPLKAEARGSSTWLPRPRGGSSVVGDGLAGHLGGSPAHAGIVPERTSPWRVSSRLPRPRGDRPPRRPITCVPVMAPPPTRGSSRHHGRDRHQGGGSPAHAGIVPVVEGAYSPRQRLPRPRGDRP